MSKLGIHSVIGPRTGFGDLLRAIAATPAANPIVIKTVDDYGICEEAKRMLGVRALTVARRRACDNMLNPGDTAQHNADGWWDCMASTLAAHPYVDVWESYNEIHSAYTLQADITKILVPKMASVYHRRMCVWNFSSGTPQYPDKDGGEQYSAFLSTCAVLAQYGGFIGLHEYGGVGNPDPWMRNNDPHHTLRYRTLYAWLAARGPVPQFIISECAPSAGYDWGGNVDAFVSDLAWYDSELVKDNAIAGCCIFSLGNWEGRNNNYQDALPALTQHIVTHPHQEQPDPEPPPDEGKRLGDARVAYKRLYYRVNQKATLDQFLKAAELAYSTKSTVGFSNDDAGIGVGLAEKKVVEVGGEFTPEAIEPWYQKEYGVPPENVDHIPYPGTPVPPPVGAFKLASPVPSIPLVMTDPFNSPRNYANGKHEGVDLRAVDAVGNTVPVVACADGVVEQDIDVLSGAYGICVVLRHDWPDGNVYKTWYAHLTRNDVVLGQRVVKGQRIGLSGTTGNSTAIHLHLNLQWIEHGLSGYAVPDVVDPTPYLPPMSAPPQPARRALVGLHLRTTGLDHNALEFAGELDLIRRGRIQAVKFTSNSTFESLDALINTARIPPENIVIRLYMAGDDPNLRNPDLFYFYSRPWIAHAISRRVLRLEIHNEPNLSAEGLGFAWLSSAGFAIWYEKVRAKLKAEFPQALAGFPGLSPQPNVPEWLASCAVVIGKSDWVGAHAYWQTSEQMTQAEHGAYWQRYTPFGRPIYLTEFANVAPLSSVTKHDKGVQYVRYYDPLQEPVVAAFSFVSSALGGDFPEQTWAGSDIADTVGVRNW